MFGLVQPVDYHVTLGHGLRVEALLDRQPQLVLVHASLRLGSRHGRGHSADALVQHNVAERVLEARGAVEAVGSAVAVED